MIFRSTVDIHASEFLKSCFAQIPRLNADAKRWLFRTDNWNKFIDVVHYHANQIDTNLGIMTKPRLYRFIEDAVENYVRLHYDSYKKSVQDKLKRA